MRHTQQAAFPDEHQAAPESSSIPHFLSFCCIAVVPFPSRYHWLRYHPQKTLLNIVPSLSEKPVVLTLSVGKGILCLTSTILPALADVRAKRATGAGYC